jgi:hypothetical protein
VRAAANRPQVEILRASVSLRALATAVDGVCQQAGRLPASMDSSEIEAWRSA